MSSDGRKDHAVAGLCQLCLQSYQWCACPDLEHRQKTNHETGSERTGKENEADRSESTAAAHPKAQRKLCVHGRERISCKECRGRAICEHNNRRSQCRACGGSGICVHNKLRAWCIPCKGSQICQHSKRRRECEVCKTELLCEHKQNKRRCQICNRTKPSAELKIVMGSSVQVKCADQLWYAGIVTRKKASGWATVRFEDGSKFTVTIPDPAVRVDVSNKNANATQATGKRGKEAEEQAKFGSEERTPVPDAKRPRQNPEPAKKKLRADRHEEYSGDNKASKEEEEEEEGAGFIQAVHGRADSWQQIERKRKQATAARREGGGGRERAELRMLEAAIRASMGEAGGRNEGGEGATPG